MIVSRTFPQYNARPQPADRSGADATTATVASSPSAAAMLTKEAVAYLNPFAGATTSSYYLTEDGPVSVEVYDTMGHKVQTLVAGAEAAGIHQVKFDAGNLARGTHLHKMKTGQAVSTKRLVV